MLVYMCAHESLDGMFFDIVKEIRGGAPEAQGLRPRQDSPRAPPHGLPRTHSRGRLSLRRYRLACHPASSHTHARRDTWLTHRRFRPLRKVGGRHDLYIAQFFESLRWQTYISLANFGMHGMGS
jgi:hypothetical protein